MINVVYFSQKLLQIHEVIICRLQNRKERLRVKFNTQLLLDHTSRKKKAPKLIKKKQSTDGNKIIIQHFDSVKELVTDSLRLYFIYNNFSDTY